MAIYGTYSRDSLAGIGTYGELYQEFGHTGTTPRYHPNIGIKIVGLAGVHHSKNCPHSTESVSDVSYGYGSQSKPNMYHDCTPDCNPQYRVEMWAGRVLADRERNYHDDSDFYAIVWTGDGFSFPEYGSTRYASSGRCTVDATEEIKEEARFALAKILEDRIIREFYAASASIERGKDVIVTKGRKVPIGTIGRVEWTGDGKWGRRVRIQTVEGDEHWTSAGNVRVLNPMDYMPTPDRAQFLANKAAYTDRWAYLSVGRGLPVL